jgi:hypothetical protein
VIHKEYSMKVGEVEGREVEGECEGECEDKKAMG